MRSRHPSIRRLLGLLAIAVLAAAGSLLLAGSASARPGADSAHHGKSHKAKKPVKAAFSRYRPPPEFGFSDSGPTFLHATGAAAAAGSSVARFPISWAFIEPWQGHYRWANLDHVVATLRASGIRPLMTVTDSPPFAAPNAYVNGRFSIVPPDPEFDDEWQDFNAKLAERYPDAIFQIWSEANIPFYGQIPAARYAQLADLAAAAIHSVNPEQTVIGAAPSPGDPAWRRYFRAIYGAITDRSIAVGVNLYPRRGRSIKKAKRRLRKDFHRAKKVAHGRPVWVTETGLAGIQFGVKRQAKGSKVIYKLLARRGARAIIFHRLVDPATPINEWEDSLGTIWPDLTPKPVYKKLRRVRLRDLHGR